MRKKHCVLLAEDNFSELKLLQLAMQDSELNEIVECRVAHDGEEAIEYLGSNLRFDLVLLDLNMPRVPGKEVLQHIATDFPAHKPVIIILSNSTIRAISKNARY